MRHGLSLSVPQAWPGVAERWVESLIESPCFGSRALSTKWTSGWICAAALLSCSGANTTGTQGQGSIKFLTNYADVIREAKATGKPIFLEFRCAP